MITESILSLFFGLIDILLGFLPVVNWIVDSTAFDVLFDVLSVACWFLPMGTVGAILGIIIAINLFKIAMSVVRTVLKFIPFI